jgi:hypothetical protein
MEKIYQGESTYGLFENNPEQATLQASHLYSSIRVANNGPQQNIPQPQSRIPDGGSEEDLTEGKFL